MKIFDPIDFQIKYSWNLHFKCYKRKCKLIRLDGFPTIWLIGKNAKLNKRDDNINKELRKQYEITIEQNNNKDAHPQVGPSSTKEYSSRKRKYNMLSNNNN